MLSTVRGIVSSPIVVAPCAPEPVDAGPHHRRAQPLALAVGTHGERPHPPFGARAVHHVERHHVAVGIAPHHRAVAGVLDRVAPDERVELRHPHARPARRGCSVGERLGEDPVERDRCRGASAGRARGALRSGRHIVPSHRLVPRGRDAARDVEPDADDPVEALAHRSMWVMRMTCGKRSARLRSRSTTRPGAPRRASRRSRRAPAARAAGRRARRSSG